MFDRHTSHWKTMYFLPVQIMTAMEILQVWQYCDLVLPDINNIT